MQRKLAAILAADVVGYSRLMNKDETGTLAALKQCEAEIVEPTVTRHNGRIFKRMGDGYLAEFASAVDVVECALDWQEQLQANDALSLKFRIGVNLGDVIVDADDVYGDGVNIASRLEALAQPGCVALSDDAFRQVRDRLDADFQDLGEHALKNIPRPVRVWEWRCKMALPAPLKNAALPRLDKPSIVLMPFRNLTGDEDQDFLAEGLRIDIQNALIKVSGLYMVAAGTANALRGVSSEDAGGSLNVRYVLQGSVRKAGKRIRVTAELTDTVAGEVVWAEQYDRIMDDAFELQDEIAARILTAMNVKLVAGEQAKIWHKTLKDLRALELFYKGVHAFFQMGRDEMASARQYFEKVAKLHPEVATGATWVALSHWFDIQRGWTDLPENSRRLAIEWAEKAGKLNDSDGQAHTVLSHVYLMSRQFDDALAAGRQAVARRPACANANAFFANVLHYCGANDEAVRHIELAMRSHPLNPPFFKNVLASVCLARGDLQSAISAATQAIEQAPADIPARLILASALFQSGQEELARQTASEIRNLDHTFSVHRFANAQTYRDPVFIERLASDLRSLGLPD